VHIVYEKDAKIWWLHKPVSGSWSIPQQISDGIGVPEAHQPQILDGAVAVWQGEHVARGYDIFYNIRKEGTNQWFGSKNLSYDVSPHGVASKYPQIAVKLISVDSYSTYRLYCAWTEGNTAPYEVKFKVKDIAFPYYSGCLITDTKWDENIYVTGDVVVDSGITLTIEPGVSVFLSSTDDQCSGKDTTKPEFIVADAGSLFVEVPTDTVEFVIPDKNFFRIATMGSGFVRFRNTGDGVIKVGHESE
jgi:hypothetical protein